MLIGFSFIVFFTNHDLCKIHNSKKSEYKKKLNCSFKTYETKTNPKNEQFHFDYKTFRSINQVHKSIHPTLQYRLRLAAPRLL